MQAFVRMSKLTNIVGRADYISNPERQEHIVLARCYADWKPYQAFERTHRRSDKANNEGRELIIALPNEWEQLAQTVLASRINELAQNLLPGKTEYQWAVHWNKAHSNLHVHLIFSERERLNHSSGKVWDRDIYLTQDGKIARRKADRAVDRNGKVKPPVHRKGDPKDDGKLLFSVKDTKFKSKEWLEQAKQTVAEVYQKYGVPIDEKGFLHQFHEGKGKEAAEIHRKNLQIKASNRLYASMAQSLQFNYAPDNPNYRKAQKLSRNNDFHLTPNIVNESFGGDLKFGTDEFGNRFGSGLSYAKYPAEEMEFAHKFARKLKENNIISWIGHFAKTKESVLLYYDINNEAFHILKALQREQQEAATRTTPKTTQNEPVRRLSDSELKNLATLKHRFIYQYCANEYLKKYGNTSNSSQTAFNSANELVSRFGKCITRYYKIEAELQKTINPFKKHSLRSELDEIGEEAYRLAFSIKCTLNITWIYNGQELTQENMNSEHLNALYGYTNHPLHILREKQQSEIKHNKIVNTIKSEKIDDASVQAAYQAFVKACAAVPEEQFRAALSVLSERTPYFDFEDYGHNSPERLKAQDAATKVFQRMYKPNSEQVQSNNTNVRTIDDNYTPRMIRR